MLRYFIRRMLWVFPVLLGVATITFILMQVIPGDPALLLVGQHGDEETVRAIRSELGLDRPVYVQYVRFIGRLARGDLGRREHQLVAADVRNDRCWTLSWNASRPPCGWRWPPS